MVRRRDPRDARRAKTPVHGPKSKAREPTSRGPDPTQPLKAALEGIASVLDALSQRFNPEVTQEGPAGDVAREGHLRALQMATAQAAGGAAVIVTMMSSDQRHGIQKQVQGLSSLWNMLAVAVDVALELVPTTSQASGLYRGYQLLSECARTGQEEKGLEAIRTIAIALEPDGAARRTVLALHTKGQKVKQDAKLRRSLTNLHRLTQCSMIVYSRTGFLHCYLAEIEK